MSRSACFVAVRGDVPAALEAEEVGQIAGGWTVYRPRVDWLYPAALESLAVGLAAQCDSVAIAAFVETSDIAYVAAVTPDGVVSRLLFGEEAARDLEEGIEALGLIGEGGASASDTFEMWSQLTGHPLGADHVRDLQARDWVFADDALDALFTALGIQLPWDRL